MQPAMPLADHCAGNGGEEQGHQPLHGKRTENHFSDKDGGGKRGVIDGCQARRGGAGGQHPAHVRAAAALQPGSRKQRAAQRRQLDHRAFLADRAAADDGEERGHRPQQRDPHRQPPAAICHRFHIVGRAAVAAGQPVGQDQQRAGQRTAHCGYHHAPAQRQCRKDDHYVGMAGKQHHAGTFQRLLEQRGGNGRHDADRDGGKEGDFLVFKETQAHGGLRGAAGCRCRRGGPSAEPAMIAQRHLAAPMCAAAHAALPHVQNRLAMDWYTSDLSRGRATGLPGRLSGRSCYRYRTSITRAIPRSAHRVRRDGRSSNSCLFPNSACPKRLCVRWPNRATPHRLLSRRRRSRPSSRAATCSPAPRPAPARPPASPCRCCTCCPSPPRPVLPATRRAPASRRYVRWC
ncbi:hypothetical protein D9M68_618930 [compost metagenome]